MKILTSIFATVLFTVPASAALLSSQADNNPLTSSVVLDGTIGVGEYPATYNNGGGSGFGGTLGGGTFSFDSSATTLYIGYQPGASLNDLAVLWLDTRSGGFSDADMNDQADGGRRAVSNAAGNADDAFPISPDYGIVFASFGVVSFELNAGSTPGHLNFVSYDGTFTGSGATPREFSIPLSSIGNPTQVNWFAGYVSDGGYGSNESFPLSTPLNLGGNVGTDPTSLGYANYNSFEVIAVPEPGTLALGGIGALLLAARLRFRK